MSRALTIALSIAVLSTTGCASPAVVADVAALAEQAGAAVWSVDANGCGWRSRGSAFAIDARHLLTNRHVVAIDSSPTVLARDGRKLEGRVIGARAHPDVAVIEVAEDLGPTLGWAPTDALRRDEPVVVIGYPRPAHRFAASTGRLVSFQGRDREAALSNVPIDLGNSGGPGVRADGSVSGLVTQMALRDDRSERVAILFTARTIESVVSSFLREPTEVLSTCGLGPDYVPPVPESYEIDEVPPTEAPVKRIALPVSTPAPTPDLRPAPNPAATAEPSSEPSNATPCPDGRVTASVKEVTAIQKEGEPDTWLVDASGDVRNATTSDVYVEHVDVELDSDPEPVTDRAIPTRRSLAPNDYIGWAVAGVEVHRAQKPTAQDVAAMPVWRWSGGDLAHCPTS